MLACLIYTVPRCRRQVVKWRARIGLYIRARDGHVSAASGSHTRHSVALNSRAVARLRMDATSYFQYTCFMARRGSYSWRTRLGSVNVAAASVNSESALAAGSYPPTPELAEGDLGVFCYKRGQETFRSLVSARVMTARQPELVLCYREGPRAAGRSLAKALVL